MNELQIFNSSEFGEIRTIIKDGKPMLCLADVCKALELEQVSRVKARLKEDGVTTSKVIDRLGREQEATFINESNLYKTIFQSRKKSAERFTDWVTSEVLPSIRTTGSYSVPDATPAAAVALEERINELEKTLLNKLHDTDLALKVLIGNKHKTPLSYEECLPSYNPYTAYAETRNHCVELASRIEQLWGPITTHETPYQKIYNTILSKYNINVYSCAEHYNAVNGTSYSPFSIILSNKTLTDLFITTAEDIISSIEKHESLDDATSLTDALAQLSQLAIQNYSSNILTLYRKIYKMMQKTKNVDWSAYDQHTPKLKLIKDNDLLQAAFIDCINQLTN